MKDIFLFIFVSILMGIVVGTCTSFQKYENKKLGVEEYLNNKENYILDTTYVLKDSVYVIDKICVKSVINN